MDKEVISGLISMLQASKDFVLEHAPDVLREIIYIAALDNGMRAAGSIIATIFFAMITMRIYRNFPKPNWSSEDLDPHEFMSTLWLGVSSVLSFLSACGIYKPLYMTLKILIAPKLFLLEYLANLL